MRVVAIQPRLALGEVEANLRRIERLVDAAVAEHAPQLVCLPESMTTPNLYDRRMRTVARPLIGEPLALLRRLARRHDCLVGGGFIAVRGEDARGTYALCEPGGDVHLHDKDQPSFWEHNYYAPGVDPGIMRTSLGVLGCANGWEWGRTRTVRRLRAGGARMVVGGMHFPGVPDWKLTAAWFRDRDNHLLTQYCRETPPRLARMLGVPVVHPSHVGDFTMATPLAPGLSWRSACLGETQICDADGVPLARLSYGDGEGWVGADVELPVDPRPRDPTPDTFWNASFPLSAHLVWYAGNAHGRAKYLAMKRLGLHRWQAGEPAADLPALARAEDLPPVEDPGRPAGRAGSPARAGAVDRG
ncbi:carbon-nitrogen hydrolase family protein [Patulibacter brassicae]|uniref:Carbon-nitrogen hydrolase family protein n=1 Tax=Patulibacter brassicae TaxID=1705717 RepID=A0ABU4VQ81_9ACTN|nr:carbon-nitrogen hydrolase family protein [Patulibacter brassicae]MDX8153794.1 carbon-nitrogen hydrolase family protein [Patulibacter brassicae]